MASRTVSTLSGGSLLSHWSSQRAPDPDFGRLRQALLRQGTPDRLPLFEIRIDDEVLAALLGEPVQNPGYLGRRALRSGDVSRDAVARYVGQLSSAYHHLGYDYMSLPVYLPMATPIVLGEDTASLRREKGRAWVDEAHGPISTREDLERFPWCRVQDADLSAVEIAAQTLPEGMKLVVATRGIMEWLMRLMGLEPLCFALKDDPGLVGDIAAGVGRLVAELLHRMAEIEQVGAIALYDDMGFKTGTFLSPADLVTYVLPWTQHFATIAHAHGLPFILHACGNLEGIMDLLIDKVGIDAKHSFEDTILPMPEVKARYGQRIGILGGVDMHRLASGTPEEIRAAARQAIAHCAPGGGFAFGSGNTIANYVPVGAYLAMLDEARNT